MVNQYSYRGIHFFKSIAKRSPDTFIPITCSWNTKNIALPYVRLNAKNTTWGRLCHLIYTPANWGWCVWWYAMYRKNGLAAYCRLFLWIIILHGPYKYVWKLQISYFNNTGNHRSDTCSISCNHHQAWFASMLISAYYFFNFF